MGKFRPIFNRWARGNRHQHTVTLFPNSYSPGLNMIAYNLMPSKPMLPFRLMLRFTPHGRFALKSGAPDA